MPSEHARLSASGSKKWLNCPGSLAFEEQFDDKRGEDSPFAAEGTKAHALGELKIRYAQKSMTKRTFIKKVSDLDADEEMQDYTDGYCDYVMECFETAKRDCPDAKLLIEERIDLSEYIPGGFGTGDAVIVGKGLLEIIDLKYGKGVKVDAEDNPQLRLYALGALAAYDWLYGVENVRMHIYQPRISNISVSEAHPEELYMWGDLVKQRAAAALEENAPCIAGSYCDEGFCKARPKCRAYAEKRQELAKYDFAPPKELSDDEIAEVLIQAEALSAWAKAVSDYALEQAVGGTKYPGFKLVAGRSVRTFTDEQEVARRITDSTDLTFDDIYNRKLKGITDMEKLIGKKRFGELLGDLIIKPQGKPTLVKDSDKRPEISTAASAAEDFKDIIKGE